MRILITGSRKWFDWNTFNDALNKATKDQSDIVIVHGDCPTGADSMAKDWALYQSVIQEPHPAEWDRYGKRAGYVRNAEMVELGADLCLAFIKFGSPGSTMTANLAEKKGIEVRRYLA